jgi:hypothetical protein
VRRLVPKAKAPLALAGFLALPLFFASLMATSLAIEKAQAFEWERRGRLIRVFHEPAAGLEAKIWLLSFAVPLLLVVVGAAASHLRRLGAYVVALSAIVLALLLTVRLDTWERHHTARFPFGEDLYPDSSTSSLTARGQWEANAVHTAHSLVGYTVALSLAAMAIALVLEWRRRRGARPEATPLGASELQQTGTAPTVSSG